MPLKFVQPATTSSNKFKNKQFSFATLTIRKTAAPSTALHIEPMSLLPQLHWPYELVLHVKQVKATLLCDDQFSFALGHCAQDDSDFIDSTLEMIYVYVRVAVIYFIYRFGYCVISSEWFIGTLIKSLLLNDTRRRLLLYILFLYYWHQCIITASIFI